MGKTPAVDATWPGEQWRRRVLAESLNRWLEASLGPGPRSEALAVARTLLSFSADEWTITQFLRAVERLIDEPFDQDRFCFAHQYLLADVHPLLDPKARAAAVYARLAERVIRSGNARWLLQDFVSEWVRARAPDFRDDPRLARLDERATQMLGYDCELTTF